MTFSDEAGSTDRGVAPYRAVDGLTKRVARNDELGRISAV